MLAELTYWRHNKNHPSLEITTVIGIRHCVNSWRNIDMSSSCNIRLNVLTVGCQLMVVFPWLYISRAGDWDSCMHLDPDISNINLKFVNSSLIQNNKYNLPPQRNSFNKLFLSLNLDWKSICSWSHHQSKAYMCCTLGIYCVRMCTMEVKFFFWWWWRRRRKRWWWWSWLLV